MTEGQKEQVLNLRRNGYGYLKIANETGVSVNTVKSFCRRNGCHGNTCLACGKTLTQTKGHRKKRFCSDGCRMLWWNSHRDAVKHGHLRIGVCSRCGTQFKYYGKTDRKYCSRECYFKARFGGECCDG